MLNRTSAPQTDPGDQASDAELDEIACMAGAGSAKDVRDTYDK